MSQDALIRRIQANPHDDAAWSALFAELADGPAAAAVGLVTSRHQFRRDAAQFTYQRVIELAKAGKHAALQRLYEAEGATGAFRGLFAYGLALCATREFRLQAAVPLMREAAFMNAHCCQQLFAHEAHFCTDILGQVLQQAALLEDAAYVSAGYAAPAIDLPDLAPGSLLVFTACCETYFKAYAERFIAQLAEVCPMASYLIHVLNPTAEGEALRLDLRRRFPRGGFSMETCPEDGAFYASRRFMVAPSVRARYHADLVIMDVDSVFKPELAAIFDTSRSAGLAYFGNSDEILPSLLIAAAYLYLPSGSPVADAFLGHVGAYLERKLGEAVVPWTVDQTALFRALCLLGEDRSRMIDLARVVPGGVNVIVAEKGHEVPEQIRMSRRSKGDILNVEFDEDHRPTLSAK